MKKMPKSIIIAVVLSIILMFQFGSLLSFAATEENYIHEESFGTDYNMSGLFDSINVSFNAGEWKMNDAVLTLYFSVTPLVYYDVSNFSVSLNDQRFYSSRIPLTKGQSQQTQINIPVELIKKGVNQLKLESYIRTSEAEPCSDDISKASWMTVLKDSSVAISYTPLAKCESVADLYEQFTSIDALENNQSAVYVRPNASEAELTSAAYILSGISANAAVDYDNIGFSSVDNESILMSKKYSIYLSKYNSMLQTVREKLTKEQVEAVQQNQTILALVKLSENSNVLVVTGSNEDAIINASKMFGNNQYIKQVKAQWRKVTADEKVTFEYNQEAAKRPLTKTGTYVNGPFRQDATFYVESYPNRILDVGSEISLKYRYSENLDFNRSLVTVYINDTPIGSKKLTKEMSKADNAKFNIPANLNIKGNFTINVAFDLEIADLWCTLRQDDMPWAYITNESTTTINSVDASALIFEYYPGPFISNGQMNNVAVVLPEQPSKADLNVMRKVILTIGRFQKDNSGEINVMHSNNIRNISNSNVINIGRLQQNPIVQQLNGQLYFQFTPKGTTIASNEKMQIEPNYGATLGTAQLLYSPYSIQKKALLVISGISDDAMLKASEYLGSTDKIWQVAGDGFVADSNDVYYYRFKQDNAPTTMPGIGKINLLPLALVGSSVCILLIIAALLLMHKYRRN